MLIPTEVALAMRCPDCGRMELTTLSRFTVHGGESTTFRCSCGSEKLMVGFRDGQVWLRIPCYLCDGLHFYYYTPREFWNASLTTIPCPETDLQVGVLGPVDQVDTYTRTGGTELDRLLEDEGFGEYFDHPDVMYQVLSWVHSKAEEGNLSCSCGNRQIAVDIYPEHLDLTCPSCGSYRSILARTEEDLAALECMTSIEVGDDTPTRRKGHKK